MEDKVDVTEEQTSSEPVVKKRRRRRTKAQIEADRLAAEMKLEQEKSSSNSEPEESSVAVQEIAHTEVKVKEFEGPVSVKEEVKSEPVTQEESVLKIASDKATPSLKSSFIGKFKVYEAPYIGAYFKSLYSAFLVVCTVNEFYQVQYMKHGFGVVKGYIKISDVE